MLGFSIMGTPGGFEIINAGMSKGVLEAKKVDLDNSLINVWPDTDIVMAFRELVGGSVHRCYVYYRFATEIATTRPGSFYGSVLLLIDSTAHPEALWRGLTDLADIVKENCLTADSKFHRDINSLSYDVPASIQSLASNLTPSRELASLSSETGFLFLLDEVRTYPQFFETFDHDESLKAFQKIYASSAAAVFNDVVEKGRLPVVKLVQLRFEQDQARRREEERRVREVEEEKKRHEEEEIRRAQEGNERQRTIDERKNHQRLDGKQSYPNKDSYDDQSSLTDAVEAVTVLVSRNALLEKRLIRCDKEIAQLKDKLARRDDPKWSSYLYKYKWYLIGLVLVLIVLGYFVYSFLNSTYSTTSQNERSSDRFTNEVPKVTAVPRNSGEDASTYIYDGADPKIETVGGLVKTIVTLCGSGDIVRKQILSSFQKSNPGISVDETDLLKTNIRGMSALVEVPRDCKLTAAHFKRYSRSN